jgi:GntR family transcriptional regulator
VRRVRSLAGVPRLVEDIWLPLPLCAPLQTTEPAGWGDLLYPALARLCGLHIHRAVDEISFGVLNAADARTLRLLAGHPCAIVRRLSYDLAGHCVEVRTTRGDAHAFQYTVTLT